MLASAAVGVICSCPGNGTGEHVLKGMRRWGTQHYARVTGACIWQYASASMVLVQQLELDAGLTAALERTDSNMPGAGAAAHILYH